MGSNDGGGCFRIHCGLVFKAPQHFSLHVVYLIELDSLFFFFPLQAPHFINALTEL